MKAIINAKAILPDPQDNFIIKENMAILYDETITKILPMAEWAGDAPNVTDAKGQYVSPGFINIHIHGCNGKDTMDEDDEALAVIAQGQGKMGVTSFLPTTMTYDIPRIHRAFARIRQRMKNPVTGGARILGCHMEGPYVSPQKLGAQSGEYVRKANFADIADFIDTIKIITLAPEELNDNSFVAKCNERNIILSVGHTAATYDEAVTAVKEHGFKQFTHLYNAMSPFHHRNPGVVGAALDTDANCELIADNIHSHPAAQRLVYHAKGGKNIILITDSLRACGLGDGPSELGGQKVWVKGELATLEDGTIAGSVAAMNRVVTIFRENTNAPLPEVVEMVSKNPATELGLYDKIGSLEVGKLADMVVFDEKINVLAVVIGGEATHYSKTK